MALDMQEGLLDSVNGTWTYDGFTRLSPIRNTIIACLTVLGNGMVIAVMLLRRKVFNSFTNHLILNQSIIDFVGGVVFFLYRVAKPSVTTVSLHATALDQFLCRFVESDYLVWCMNCTSTYSLVIISMERFMATCYPVKHRNACTKKLKFAALLTSWSLGFVYPSLMCIIFLQARDGKCQTLELGLAWGSVHFITSLVLVYIVPLSIMMYAYKKILTVLTKKRANPVCRQNAFSKAKKNVLVTTMLTGFMFLVCWTPLEGLGFVAILKGQPIWTLPIYDVAVAMVACNMFVNPFVYCFMYQRFRSQLWEIVRARFCRQRRVQPGESISIPSGVNTTHETVVAPV